MREVYSVSQLATYLRELLETDLHLADLWVEGEVSNLSRSTAGHTYFTLKDEFAQMRCVMFRRQYGGGIVLENGAQVVAHGRISFFERRGELQLNVDFLQPAGVGIWQAQFERLKAQLEEEGLFEPSRKRPLPVFPRVIGVVTSPTGAVFHDICQIVGRRWPLAEIVLAPTPVQGDQAAPGIVDALDALNQRAGHRRHHPRPRRRLAGRAVALQRGDGGAGHLRQPCARGLGGGPRDRLHHRRLRGRPAGAHALGGGGAGGARPGGDRPPARGLSGGHGRLAGRLSWPATTLR